MPRDPLTHQLLERAFAAHSAPVLLEEICDTLITGGIDLYRASVGFDTLHPQIVGRGFQWTDGTVQGDTYLRSPEGAFSEPGSDNPFMYLWTEQLRELRVDLAGDPERVAAFPMLQRMAEAGATDYLAFRVPLGLGESSLLSEDDCYTSWATRDAGGFSPEHLAALRELQPRLGLVFKSIVLTEIAENVVETYLGRDAGRRILDGNMIRGKAERIRAVLWFSDLRGFTRISDTTAPELVIALLNDYADTLVTAIEDNGGDVLKFMGDGLLAIFPIPEGSDAGEASLRALTALKAARAGEARLSEERTAKDLPVTQFYAGLHVGDVAYGNIGSARRLDFTVIGPAVNEVARIASMTRALEQATVFSQAFAESAGEVGRRKLVSLGRYALRGVRRPQELFTLDPTLWTPAGPPPGPADG